MWEQIGNDTALSKSVRGTENGKKATIESSIVSDLRLEKNSFFGFVQLCV